ncbi:MAG TPA: aminopeptidase P family N-terminal domain-containing protein, partial [Candidatus Acidoferrales bacterium]|nr:aminopeptidase P family N-terminal domain-containing protein [Candidatus Acidoferrales bacterium]
MNTPFAKRRRALQARLTAETLDCLLVTHPPDWYYLSGFTGESGALLVGRTDATLVTDGRFTIQSREETSGVKIQQQTGALAEAAGGVLRAAGKKRVGFDPSRLHVGDFQALKKAAGPGIRWQPAPGLVQALRMQKDAGELAQMRKAAILAGDVVRGVLGLLKPGVREFEVAAEIEYQMR